MKTCNKCKHWALIPGWGNGACEESEGTMMNTFGRRACGVFLTRPSDSCKLWEARPEGSPKLRFICRDAEEANE